MKNIKKSLLAFSLLVTFSNSAGIPVIDAVSNATMISQNVKQAAEWLKEASRWAETVAHHSKQLEFYKDELNSLTGVKSSVSSLNDLRQIYSDYGRAYSSMKDFNDNLLSNPESFIDKLGDSYKKYTIFDNCALIQDEQRKKFCMIDMLTYAKQEQDINEAQEQFSQISRNLNDLETRLRQSKDIKESQDIANAISAEGTKIQLIYSNIQFQNTQYERQRRIKEEQRFQQTIKDLNTNYDTASYFKKANLIK